MVYAGRKESEVGRMFKEFQVYVSVTIHTSVGLPRVGVEI